MRQLALAGLLLLAGCMSDAIGGTGPNRGYHKKHSWAGAPGGPTEGTASRDWQHCYDFRDCVASPNFTTITDRCGSMDLTIGAATTYTCGIATTGLDETNIGIVADTAMTVTDACWTAASGIPEIADGDNWLVRIIYRDNAGQTRSNYFWEGFSSSVNYWRGLYNAIETITMNINDNGTTLNAASPAFQPQGEWRTFDALFDDSTGVDTNARDNTFATATWGVDPGTWPARGFELFSRGNCLSSSRLQNTDVVGVWISYCADTDTCAAAEMDQAEHFVDCQADGSC